MPFRKLLQACDGQRAGLAAGARKSVLRAAGVVLGPREFVVVVAVALAEMIGPPAMAGHIGPGHVTLGNQPGWRTSGRCATCDGYRGRCCCRSSRFRRRNVWFAWWREPPAVFAAAAFVTAAVVFVGAVAAGVAVASVAHPLHRRTPARPGTRRRSWTDTGASSRIS